MGEQSETARMHSHCALWLSSQCRGGAECTCAPTAPAPRQEQPAPQGATRAQ